MAAEHWYETMSDFEYVRPDSLEQALALLNEPGLRCRVLAGGTDLVVQLRRDGCTFDRLVDVTHLDALQGIHLDDDGTATIGAAVILADLLDHSALGARVPLIAEACRGVGGAQTRNMATIGGNVANAAACADLVPVLVCLEAVALVATPGMEQSLPVADLVVGENQTCLPPGSLIRAFAFELPPDHARMIYLRVARRRAMAVARVALAALSWVDGVGRIAEARLVPGAAFDRPRRVPEIERLLLGETFDEQLAVTAGEQMRQLYAREMSERWSVPYKQRVLAALTERAVRHCFGDG